MNGYDRLVMEQARKQNGDQFELDLVSEECSELVHALHKHKRYNTKETRENVIEEIADVKIMVAQAEDIFGRFNVGVAVKRKIKRLEERLEAKAKEQTNGRTSPI